DRRDASNSLVRPILNSPPKTEGMEADLTTSALPCAPAVCGLVSFHLPNIFRCAVDLAEAVATVFPADWENLPIDIEGPGSPQFDRWREWHRRLSRIKEESTRLKKCLGATGPFSGRELVAETRDGGEVARSIKWESFEQEFADTTHDRIVRLALIKWTSP